jgi:EF hand
MKRWLRLTMASARRSNELPPTCRSLRVHLAARTLSPSLKPGTFLGNKEDFMMMRLVTGALVVLAIATGPALAQTTPPAAPDAAVEAKFKAADKNSNGALEGAEVDAFKANLTKIDTNKDGKVTRDEFAAATKAGTIK